MAVDYKQNDKRWKNKLYSVTGNKNQTMGKSGCGPTAAADVIATFCDPSVNPWEIAQLFMKKGFRTKNNGTAYAAFKWLATLYRNGGIGKFAQGKSMANMRKSLEQGALVICSMGPGYWTNGGHYIVAHKMDDAYVYCLDPGSKKRKKQPIAAFSKQVKKMFCYWQEVR